MKKTSVFVYLCALFIITSVSFSPAQDKAQAGEAALPYTPSLDVNAMDRSADPCVDLYRFSCGGWQKNNPVPPDQTSWSVYGKLYQDNVKFLRGILEQAASDKGKRDLVTQEIGGFYASCVDEAAVEKRGVAAIRPQLDAIAKLKSAQEMAPLVAQFHLGGVGTLFNAGSNQDPDNSEQQIAAIFQGGLGLPDRDYYVKDDAKSKEIRERYVQHVQKMFELLGESPEAAQKNAATVMRLETALANASMTRVERRDPYKRKNKIKIADLQVLAPNFNWQAYFVALKAPQFEIVNAAPPAFFKELNAQLASASLDDWKSYLRFHLVNGYAEYLPSAFVNEDFAFYRKYLRGAQELEPRWKRCVQQTDGVLGEALGQAFVAKVFGPELKASTLDMVHRIESAMELRIQQLDWMGPETKQQALAKLHAIRNKVGYPDKWRDYSSVKIARGDYLGNVQRTSEFERHRNLNKIGKPVDHGEWGMSPPTVNAYFNPQMNDINFPAGVLQPPLYDARMDDAPNYGDTGGTIGHELTHGFDDEGSQFDFK